VRCRFFLSGPAFLDGLIDHFNSLSYQMSESSERYNKLGKQVEALEDEQIACTEQELPFTKGAEFQKLSRVYEIEAEKCDKVSADWGATARLVKRSIEIMITKKDVQDDKLSLVAVGSMEDLQSILIEVSELHQLQVLCDGATVYAETDATKAVLRRSQTLDFWLEGNGLAPMFFKLPVDLQHQFGNEIMNLLKLRMGSIKGAVDVVEGLKSLESLGMLGNVTELLEKRTGMSLKLNGTKTVDIPCPVELLPTGTGGY